MGRQVPADYVEASEACHQLGVTRFTLNGFVKKGLLRERGLDGQRGVFFLKNDIIALEAALAEGEDTDPKKSMMMALMAMSSARRIEHLVEMLFDQLGLDIVPLDRDPSAINSLYAEASYEPTHEQLGDPDFLRYWGRVFFAMDEAYLELVTHVTEDDEPWKCFLDLASKTILAARKQDEGQLADAIKVLEAGRNHLRHVGYMLCRNKNGRRVADVVFNGRARAVDELMAILG